MAGREATAPSEAWIRLGRIGALILALFATGGVAEAQGATRLVTHETTKGGSCSIRVHATTSATTTHGITSERCDTKRGVESVNGGSFLLRDNGQPVPGSLISLHDHLPYRLEGTYNGSVEPAFQRGDFSVVLHSPQTRRPERWRRRSVPTDCVVSTTHHARDTLRCAVQQSTTAG